VVPAPDGLVLRPAAHANDASGAVGTSDAAGLVNDLEPAQRIDSMIVAPTAAIGEGALAGYESDRPTLRPLVVSHSGAGLQQALERSSLDAADATRLTSRAMVLARGAYIGCVLETQLISNIAGFVSCIVSDNVYSDDGHVLLIERGSHVTGEYRSDSRQGDTRLFVLWNRIKTVHGVLIDIDSPGGDAVGGQGLPGYRPSLVGAHRRSIPAVDLPRRHGNRDGAPERIGQWRRDDDQYQSEQYRRCSAGSLQSRARQYHQYPAHHLQESR
jgi:hypothetical protein